MTHSDPDSVRFPGLAAEISAQMGAICDFFEQRLITNQPAQIEDFLGSWEPAVKRQLFRELLLLEFQYRPESRTQDEYLVRFPEYADTVREVFVGSHDPSTFRPMNKQYPVIPNYVIYRELGAGGMGTVYRAIHTILKNEAALKVLRPDRLVEGDISTDFVEETRNLGQLQHPHVVRALYAGVADGLPFLVMELVDGLDAFKVIRRYGPLRVADACEIVRQAASGLQHAHELGMIHRDIKPSNLLLGWTSKHRDQVQVKVADFGLARLRHKDSTPDSMAGYSRVRGTFDFMAPEQFYTPGSVDIRADIYSLGCTLYTLLTGRPPFSEVGQSVTARMEAHRDLPLASILTKRPDVPVALEEIIAWMMAKRPELRYESPAEVEDVVAHFCSSHDLPRVLEIAQERQDPPAPSLPDTETYTRNHK